MAGSAPDVRGDRRTKKQRSLRTKNRVINLRKSSDWAGSVLNGALVQNVEFNESKTAMDLLTNHLKGTLAKAHLGGGERAIEKPRVAVEGRLVYLLRYRSTVFCDNV